MTDFELSALAYDTALCGRLRAAGCQGKEWEAFSKVLYKRAVTTTYRWIKTGVIFLHCRKRGRAIAPGDVGEWQEDDLRALAHDTVADNFLLFRNKGILGGEWDARKGASLFTYFMNGVALCFPNVFRRFERARRQQRQVDLHDDLDTLDQTDTSDYSTSLNQCLTTLKELLDAIPTVEQRAVAELYLFSGLSAGQIAQRLGITAAAARSSWNRARQAMQRKHVSVEGGRL